MKRPHSPSRETAPIEALGKALRGAGHERGMRSRVLDFASRSGRSPHEVSKVSIGPTAVRLTAGKNYTIVRDEQVENVRLMRTGGRLM